MIFPFIVSIQNGIYVHWLKNFVFISMCNLSYSWCGLLLFPKINEKLDGCYELFVLRFIEIISNLVSAKIENFSQFCISLNEKVSHDFKSKLTCASNTFSFCLFSLSNPRTLNFKYKLTCITMVYLLSFN